MARPIDNEWRVETPEHIEFVFRPAGLVVRSMAYTVDLAIRLLSIAVIGLAASGIVSGEFGLAAALIAWFCFEWLYGAAFESTRLGGTPGKLWCGIRVVRQDGMNAGFGACFLRNALRTADFLPTAFLAAISTMSLSRGFRRLGDLAAGTMVVYREKRRIQRTKERADPDVIAMADDLPEAILESIDVETLGALASFVETGAAFSMARRREIARHLARPLMRRFQMPHDTDPVRLLEAVHRLATSGRSSEVEGSQKTKKHDPVAAHLAGRRNAWKKIETALEADTKKTNDARVVVDAASNYRSLCADLSMAMTSPTASATIDYLHGLVAGAHLAFYVPERRRGAWFRELLLERGPAALFRSKALRLALLVFYGCFFGSAVLGAYQPDAARNFIGTEMVDQLFEMYRDTHDDRQIDAGTTMAAFYIQHNVGIALSCFATGIFFGIGSIVTLVFNGLFLGFCFGVMWNADEPIRANFFEFVTAHGPFELTGIACSGAAGMVIGWGLVETRGLPRMESLVLAARRTIPMILAASFMVAMAAPIEGFASPSSLPIGMKRAIAIVSAATIIFYIGVLGARAREAKTIAESPR